MKIFLSFLLTVIYSIAVFAQTWTKKPNFPELARRAPVIFTIGLKAYVVSGESANLYVKDVWEYDQSYDLWTRKNDFPGPGRYSGSGFSINGKGYVISGTANGVTTCYNDFWRYDPATDSWTKLANLPMACRDNAVAFSYGGKGYYGTGRLFSNLLQQLVDLWEYDPQKNTWTQLPDVPGTGRASATSWVIGDKAYVGYGITFPGVFQPDMYEFDFATKTWTFASVPGFSCAATADFQLGNFGFVASGAINNYFDESNETWAYSPGSKTWQQLPSFPGTPMAASMGFALGSSGYVLFGTCDSIPYMSDFYELTLPPQFFGVGLNETNDNDRLRIFPNPVTGYLVISSEQHQAEGYSIYNTQGNLLEAQPLTAGTEQIDLRDYPVGIYFLRLITSDGKIYHKKFLKN